MTDTPNVIIDLGDPDVTEAYAMPTGDGLLDICDENTAANTACRVSYGDLGPILQADLDAINARESTVAGDAAETSSYGEDAGDGKLLNHARRRLLGLI